MSQRPTMKKKSATLQASCYGIYNKHSRLYGKQGSMDNLMKDHTLGIKRCPHSELSPNWRETL